MKTIISGSRFYKDISIVEEAIKLSGFTITEVVSGGANGIDTLGEEWAKKNGIPIKVFKADWQGLGKMAGPKRNIAMGSYAQALIACPHQSEPSTGTRDMIYQAKKNGLKVFVYQRSN